MKISAIVPVYNSENYVGRCIESVLSQTYQDWELILVDDGSIDISLRILRDYEKKDCRIKVIHQDNKGPGMARNNGIKYATGEFVVFLDSDDYIDKDYFKLLNEKGKNSDVVFIDVLQVDFKLKVLKEEKMSIYQGLEKEEILRSQMTGKIPWGGVRKAVRLSLLKENNIEYTSHKIGEEALYSFRVLYIAKSIAFISEKPVYYYVNHENSQSKLKVSDPWGKVVESLKKYLKEENLYEKFSETINAFNITALVISLDRIEKMYKGNKKKDIINERIRYFNKIYDNTVGIDKKNMDIKAKIFIPFIMRKKYFVILLCSKIKDIITK